MATEIDADVDVDEGVYADADDDATLALRKAIVGLVDHQVVLIGSDQQMVLWQVMVVVIEVEDPVAVAAVVVLKEMNLALVVEVIHYVQEIYYPTHDAILLYQLLLRGKYKN